MKETNRTRTRKEYDLLKHYWFYSTSAVLRWCFFFSQLDSRVQCSGLNYFHFFDNKLFFVVAVVVVEREISRKKAFIRIFLWNTHKKKNFRACPSDVWSRQCGILSRICIQLYIYSLFFLNQLCISLQKGQRATHTPPGTRLNSIYLFFCGNVTCVYAWLSHKSEWARFPIYDWKLISNSLPRSMLIVFYFEKFTLFLYFCVHIEKVSHHAIIL